MTNELFNKVNSISVGKTTESTNSSSSALFNKISSIKTGKEKTTVGSVLKSVGSVAYNTAKDIVKQAATITARPFQAIAELSGATDTEVNDFTKKYFGGLVREVPQNLSDVKKDVGSALQTVALGVGGPASKLATKVGSTVLGASKLTPTALNVAKAASTATKIGTESALFGAGMSMAEGNNLLSKETVKDVALTAGTIGGLSLIGKGIKAIKVGKATTGETKTGTQISKEIPVSTIQNKTTKNILSKENVSQKNSSKSYEEEFSTPTYSKTSLKLREEALRKGIDLDYSDLGTYEKSKGFIKQQESKAEDFIKNDTYFEKTFEKLKNTESPEIERGALYNKMKEEVLNMTDKDLQSDLINKLSRVTATNEARALKAFDSSLSTDIDVISTIKDINDTLYKNVSKRIKNIETIKENAVSKTEKVINDSIASKNIWSDYIKSLKC